jgi:hypothetical protein
MKEEMLKYLRSKDKDGFENWCHPQQHWIEDFIECFFDQYQPERSKREDFTEYTPKEIGWALDKAFKQEMSQESYDILKSVCDFAKMRYSEHGGNIVRKVQ